jgi:hypothetical protein
MIIEGDKVVTRYVLTGNHSVHSWKCHPLDRSTSRRYTDADGDVPRTCGRLSRLAFRLRRQCEPACRIRLHRLTSVSQCR